LDNGFIYIGYQTGNYFLNKQVKYDVINNFPKIPERISFMNVNEHDIIRIHFSNATDALRNQIIGDLCADVQTYAGGLDYIDVRYDKSLYPVTETNKTIPSFMTIEVRIPSELLISTIEVKHNGMFGNQESFTTVWDLSK
jgi:hypothetical protein